MFESLADRIREDEHQTESTAQRTIFWAVVLVVSVVVFGGLYFAIRTLG